MTQIIISNNLINSEIENELKKRHITYYKETCNNYDILINGVNKCVILKNYNENLQYNQLFKQYHDLSISLIFLNYPNFNINSYLNVFIYLFLVTNN